MLKETGNVTYDPGFMNTANTKSHVTYIDGDNGILRYRGYPIEELAEHSNFVETAYLLIYGELPTREEYEDFEHRITTHTMVHEDIKMFFNGFPRSAHPMPVLSSAVSALSTFYSDSLDPFDKDQVEISTIRLLAKVPTLAAYAFKKSMGEPQLYPQNKLNYAENFLRMCFGVPAEDYEVDPVVAKTLDILLMLHADHEQNCSTSTVRLVGSSHANMFASVSAGINALYGPLHGGANESVLHMLDQIQNRGLSADEFMEKVKNKEDGVRLMGFGHRVYKNYDPRARSSRLRPRCPGQTGRQQRNAGPGHGPGREGSGGRLLRGAQALPERGLLHRPDLQGHGLPGEDVHRALRDRSLAGLDRPVARND